MLASFPFSVCLLRSSWCMVLSRIVFVCACRVLFIDRVALLGSYFGFCILAVLEVAFLRLGLLILLLWSSNRFLSLLPFVP